MTNATSALRLEAIRRLAPDDDRNMNDLRLMGAAWPSSHERRALRLASVPAQREGKKGLARISRNASGRQSHTVNLLHSAARAPPRRVSSLRRAPLTVDFCND